MGTPIILHAPRRTYLHTQREWDRPLGRLKFQFCQELCQGRRLNGLDALDAHRTPCGRYSVERTGADRFDVYGPAGKIVDWVTTLADAKECADGHA